MTDRDLLKQAYAVPLHEQLASVPVDARLVIDDQDGRGTRFIPVGRMCHEAATTLRERLAQPEPEPRREWVGLTEEDFSAINQSCLTKLQAATSAESILKEKNSAD